MATSFLRVPGIKRKTRSESVCPIIGASLEALSHSILPSKSDILRNINHKKENSPKSKFLPSDWKNLYREVKAELIEIWNAGCIPVLEESNIEIKIRRLYENEYVSLKKSVPYYEKNPEKKKSWLKNISQEFSVCFDIAACDHFKSAKSKDEIFSSHCDCVAAKKIPVEELEFYASQKFDRDSESLLVIGTKVDKKNRKI